MRATAAPNNNNKSARAIDTVWGKTSAISVKKCVDFSFHINKLDIGDFSIPMLLDVVGAIPKKRLKLKVSSMSFSPSNNMRMMMTQHPSESE